VSDFRIGERLWVCASDWQRGRSAIVDWAEADRLHLYFERLAAAHFYVEEPHAQEHLFRIGELMLISTYRTSARMRAWVVEARGNEYLVSKNQMPRPVPSLTAACEDQA
jgi:hypothetical protein